ncbi:MAG: hypothetical protein KIG53_04490 [Oscillospiraceae bacterium]|nr:hypothetical protein [Oscillospiraceae bacterium]
MGIFSSIGKFLSGSVGGALLNAGLGVVGNFLGNNQAEKNQQKQNEFNALEAQKTRDWQEKMWNLNNEYNTPLAQVNRIREAQLNPNLVYGTGSIQNVSPMASSGAQASSTPFNDSIAARHAKNFDAIMRGLQTAITMQELKNKKLEGNNIESNTNKNNAEAKESQQRTDNLATENKFNLETFDARKISIELQNQLSEQQRLKLYADTQTATKQLDQIDAAISNLQSSTDLNKAQVENIHTNIARTLALLPKEIEQMNAAITEALSRAVANKASANASNAQAGYYGALTTQVSKLTPLLEKGAKLDNNFKEIQNKWEDLNKKANLTYQERQNRQLNLLNETQELVNKKLAMNLPAEVTREYIGIAKDITEIYKNYVGTNAQVLGAITNAAK